MTEKWYRIRRFDGTVPGYGMPMWSTVYFKANDEDIIFIKKALCNVSIYNNTGYSYNIDEDDNVPINAEIIDIRPRCKEILFDRKYGDAKCKLSWFCHYHLIKQEEMVIK